MIDPSGHIVVLTGAGISAESGLGTFRGAGGLWEGHRVEEVATPGAFARDPGLVHGFYNQRRAQAVEAAPNAAHEALAALQAQWPGGVTLITQNIDRLHEAGGAERVLHMHGVIDGALCSACGARWAVQGDMSVETPCPECGAAAARPDIVWFGEMPHGLGQIDAALSRAALFVAIGTSGMVYPAAGFVETASALGARTLEINLERTQASDLFDDGRYGPATQAVPDWVAEMLSV